MRERKKKEGKKKEEGREGGREGRKEGREAGNEKWMRPRASKVTTTENTLLSRSHRGN